MDQRDRRAANALNLRLPNKYLRRLFGKPRVNTCGSRASSWPGMETGGLRQNKPLDCLLGKGKSKYFPWAVLNETPPHHLGTQSKLQVNSVALTLHHQAIMVFIVLRFCC